MRFFHVAAVTAAAAECLFHRLNGFFAFVPTRRCWIAVPTAAVFDADAMPLLRGFLLPTTRATMTEANVERFVQVSTRETQHPANTGHRVISFESLRLLPYYRDAE